MLRIGMIGCGFIANDKHIPAVNKNSETVITALCDCSVEKAEEAKKRFGLTEAKIYEDYRELCADPEVDVVYVLTPNCLHKEMALAAFEAGKHALIEKPLALTKKDAQEIVDAAKKAGKQLTVGHQWRFTPQNLYIKELCDKGELGDIYYVKANDTRYRAHPTWGEYHSKARNGGGIIMDGAPHAIDKAFWFMNNYRPVSVRGTIGSYMMEAFDGNPWGPWETKGCDVEDTGFALITMENGATVFLECAWAMNILDAQECIIVGTEGGADMAGKNGVRINKMVNGASEIIEPDGFADDGRSRMEVCADKELELFIDSIKNGTEPPVTGESAVAVTAVLEAVYESAATGKTVTISWDD